MSLYVVNYNRLYMQTSNDHHDRDGLFSTSV